jgi:hypothetical protein
MTTDGTRLAFGHQTQIEKYREGEDKPYEVADGPRVWFDLDGTEITDPERIARLDAKAEKEQE